MVRVHKAGESLGREAELSDRHILNRPSARLPSSPLHTQTDSTEAKESKLIGQADFQLRLLLTDLFSAGRTTL